jgi:hypothetical protein
MVVTKVSEDATKVRDESRKRLTTGAENFADLSMLDKKLAISAKDKLDTEGFQSLNKDERDVLSKIGVKQTDDAVRASKIAEAEKFGFASMFGGSETEAIRKADEAIAKLDVETKLELSAKIEIDDSKLMDQTIKALEDYTAKWERRLKQALSESKQQDQLKQGNQNIQTRNGFGMGY